MARIVETRPSLITSTTAHATERSRRAVMMSALGKLSFYALLIILSIPFIAPFLWMLSTSLKEPSQVFANPVIWLPSVPQFHNYIDAWTKTKPTFTTFYMNTIFITVLATLGSLISSSLVAFGFARLQFPGRNILFFVVLATMLLPSQVTLIPQYIIYKDLSWVNTYWPLILPSWLGGGAFNIFLLRQFFLTVPMEMDDAARIDGASSFDIYWRILLPLCGPVIATITIFSVMAHWNDFFGPMIYLTRNDMKTVALGLQLFKDIDGLISLHLLMAAATTAAIPMLAIFFLFQRYFVKGIALTGVKG